MNEDQLMALIGRLYVALQVRDNELRQTRALLAEYENAARSPRATAEEVPQEDSNG